MRDIKFRGKTLEDRGMLPAGSWIEGGYYVDYCYGGCPKGKHYIVTWNSTGLGFTDLIQVDPETVGQYTGQRDKNGKEIYEWDIFRRKELSLEFTGQVIWRDDGFAIKVKRGDDVWFERLAYHAAHGDVIGSIHQNTELMEG